MKKRLSLKAAREDRGWTQVDLAARSGVKQSVISRLERGTIRDPRSSTVDALEAALDRPLKFAGTPEEVL